MQTLSDYVAARLRAGIGRAQIREELMAVGWTDGEAEQAYRDALVAQGIPLPDRSAAAPAARQSSVVDVAINVFSLMLLGLVAYSLSSLYFGVIDKVVPDALGQHGWAVSRSIQHAIASLVIAFPAYVIAIRLWFRRFRVNEERGESALTKWLTYIVLLAASVTVIGDLITVLYTLLQGALTLRFVLKALALLVVAGLVFGFYALERRRVQYRKVVSPGLFRVFGWVVGVLGAAGIALGFFFVGSPEHARQVAFDHGRVGRLEHLPNCIENYARNLDQLPDSLQRLGTTAYTACGDDARDPATEQYFEYRVVSPERVQGQVRVGDFELCATFALPSEEEGKGGASDMGWTPHPAGRVCRTFTVRLGDEDGS